MDIRTSLQIDEWLEYLPIFDKGSEFEAGCSYLDSYLLTNTFLVGHEVSIADICLWSALAGSDLKSSMYVTWCTQLKSSICDLGLFCICLVFSIVY